MALLIKIDWLLIGLNALIALLSPVFIGFCIAFVLNRPYVFFFNLFSKLRSEKSKKPERITKLIKGISLFLIYLLFFAFLALIISMILPQLGSSLSQVYDNIQTYITNISDLLNKLEGFIPVDTNLTESIKGFLTDFLKNLPETIQAVLPNLFNVTKTVASSLTNWLLGFIMSVYMLASKETLIKQAKNVFYTYMPTKPAKKITHALRISNEIFGNFVNGRIYDALIIGLLCFIGMSIFGFEYTLLITVLVAVTNVIPIFGPFIGAIPSIFLLLMVDPMQAVWFTVFIIVLQQLDGNLIGPKVVGDSIGLPAWWVMFSILIGGGVGGVFGMLVGVPVFAVLYRLLSEAIEERKAKKAAATQQTGIKVTSEPYEIKTPLKNNVEEDNKKST